jgi:hexosaminidase
MVAVLGLVLGAFSGNGIAADKPDAPLALVPLPSHVVSKKGEFTLNSHTRILVAESSADVANVASQLKERLHHSTGFDIKLSQADGDEAQNAILLVPAGNEPIGPEKPLGPEGYVLHVSPSQVEITANDGAGLFYGMQTLLQHLPPQIFSPTNVADPPAWTIPAVYITDEPRFHRRGLMLDVSRHFFNKEEVKNFLDLMAQHKLNTFHWHLTDDNGWRIEIKRYPKLTQVAAWRKDIGFGLNPKDSTAYGPDGLYGGFYTQDDIREIIAYAKARYITIIPEIEMPGHSGAVLAAYPELSCSGGNVYCAGNDAAFTFLENVLGEVIDLFPGKLIHIGGDEVNKAAWNKCPKCQARIKQEGLKNANEVQSYFVKRIERYINSRGRTMIGWDEILEGGLAPNAAVMSWRGMDGGQGRSRRDNAANVALLLRLLASKKRRAKGHRRIFAAEDRI